MYITYLNSFIGRGKDRSLHLSTSQSNSHTISKSISQGPYSIKIKITSISRSQDCIGKYLLGRSWSISRSESLDNSWSQSSYSRSMSYCHSF